MPLDISSVAAAALRHSRDLLPKWLVDGSWEGPEWRCGDLSGGAGKSCAVNSKTGRWSDFQTGESGGDLVSLYAAIHRLGQGQAALAVAKEVGYPVEDSSSTVAGGRHRSRSGASGKSLAGGAAETLSGGDRRTEWRPIMPVPADAGPPPRAHIKRGPPERRWDYFDESAQLLGCVYRFRTSDGGKEVLPCVFAQHPDGRREWRWMSFDEPRPLYLPSVAAATTPLRPEKAVLVVEGEKCADVAWEQLQEAFDVVSWPGGGKALHKAAWETIKGRRVVLWPDCDCKLDRRTQQVLPELRQPGVATMLKLQETLLALGCDVRMVDIPRPGEKPDGWDIADAVADLQGRALFDWMVNRLVRPGEDRYGEAAMASEPPPPDPPRTPPSSGGSSGGNNDWQSTLIYGRRDQPVDCRENVMLVLCHHPRWRDALGFNAFAGRTESLKRTPWDSGPGEWTTDDDRELGLWLAQGCDLLVRSEANLHAGVEMAAARHKFHPVVDYLESLTWDGTDRLTYWLHECCGVEDSTYVRLAGAFFLRAMVARVWKPGAKVDHMLVLEGGQGKGKSTALSILAGTWFSDTQFKIGDKDALLQLEDVWLYEVSELDSFSRADTTAVKQFLTTLNDKFRGVYERRSKRRPRQVVMAGTTNQERYLRDMTGNRRFWPVSVGEVVDLDRLRDWRDQLFAQAFAEVKAGQRWWPTREEEREHFIPAQDNRVIVDPWLDEIAKRLETDKQFDRRTFTTAELLGVLGVSADKIDSAGQMAKRVEQIMQAMGWTRGRERRSDGTRPHVFIRPDRTGPGSDEPPMDVPL